MKSLSAIFAAASVILIAGCDTGTPGGPGVSTTPNDTTIDRTDPLDRRDMTPGDEPITTPSTDQNDATRPVDDTSMLEDTAGAAIGPEEGTFTLDVPNLATTLKQGESKAASIEIDRGENMDQDITLEFANVPTGVTLEPSKPVIKASETEADVMITASADAAVGDFTIQVNGSPQTGADATNEFKISVEEM
jgi:hypothetical protein